MKNFKYILILIFILNYSCIDSNLDEFNNWSEYLRDKGQVDLVVERKDIAKTLDTLLSILLKKNKSTIIENEDNESSKLTIQTQQAS